MGILTDKKQDICNKISRGDRDALSSLFNEYYAYLYNYGMKLIHGDDEIVKDCIQDVFLSIWINKEKVAGVKSIKSYLFSALRFTIYDELEKTKTRAARENLYYEEIDSNLYDIEQLMIHFEIETEMKNRVTQSLKKLSKRKKEAIYLRFYHGFSNEEIADIMNINTQSVYNLISESITQLQRFAGK